MLTNASLSLSLSHTHTHTHTRAHTHRNILTHSPLPSFFTTLHLQSHTDQALKQTRMNENSHSRDCITQIVCDLYYHACMLTSSQNIHTQTERAVLAWAPCPKNKISWMKPPARYLDNKKSKYLNNPYSPYLQDFFTVIFLTHSTIVNICVASCNLTTQWLHKF